MSVPSTIAYLQIAGLESMLQNEAMHLLNKCVCDKVDHPVMEKKQVLGLRQPNADPHRILASSQFAITQATSCLCRIISKWLGGTNKQ